MKNLILQNTDALFHRTGRGGMMGPQRMLEEGAKFSL